MLLFTGVRLILFRNSPNVFLRVTSTSYFSNNKQNFFNHVPINRRIFDIVPKRYHPYLHLSRWDKPTGSWLLYWPGAWSIAFGATSLIPDIRLLCLFGVGAVLLRGAGCTINDLWDKDFDRHVERTKTRPLATGQLTTSQAVTWLGIQLSLGFLILIQLNWPSIVLGVLSLIPVLFYPTMKRFTYWPQFFLGMTFSWGALMGYTAATGTLNLAIIIPLYFAGIAWTLHYDTIYGHQDKSDDILIGVKSTALRLGNDTKLWLRTFSTVMLSHLLTTGLVVGQTWPYYLGLVGVGYHLHKQIETVNLNDASSCWKAFSSNRITGWIIFGSILAGNALR
ncbi:unnamed protein product [Didymodactylos carnosus]|uniref:4-hydroxybenzoate polyprenyltransferase, mitochondrial n=1 Tax=Didymodactylos carnosus TaxID=1234261 RepID=A0A814D4S2_9BILA|nr:unnamed protein product [Didymodactylos carnosus]CAF0950869.1 unnamed protein product [Didymodactylos carnosus]CAF3594046.1 unnamed protein product [Didymodactylos carnosus]CAF3726551.1 unnamed protein product [Didymodactylos carnosus]